MSTTESVNLAGKIRQVGRVTFLRAELSTVEAAQFATIFYAIDGKEQPLGLRLDLNKKVILDSTEDETVDSTIADVTELIIEALQVKDPPVKVGSTPIAVELEIPFELRGVFWLPRETVLQSHGTLIYKPEDGLKLELSTPLKADRDAMFLIDDGEYDAVFGQLTDGSLVTLISSFITTQNFGMAGIGHAALRVNRCIFGIHIAPSTNAVFTRMHLRLSALEAWIGAWAFKHNTTSTPGSDLVSGFTFTMPPTHTIRLPSELLTITLSLGLSEKQKAFRSVTLTQYASITVESEVERDIDGWMSVATKLQNLFSIFIGNGIAFRELSLTPFDRMEQHESRYRRCPVMFKQRDSLGPAHEHPSEMVVPLGLIADRLEQIVQGWFSLDAVHQHVIQVLVGDLFYFNLPVEIRLLTVVSALEIYHRASQQNHLVDERVFGDLVGKLIGMLPDVESYRRDMLYQSLIKANDYPLAARLRDLVNIFPLDFRQSLRIGETGITELIIAERERLLHGKASGHVALSTMTLFNIVDRLRMLLYALIVRDTGIDADTTAKRLQDHRYFEWALQKPIDTIGH